MKVLVIMGSPRKGNTYRACEEFRCQVQKGCAAEFEYVWLMDLDLKSCKGCFVCFPQGEDKCPYHDDVRDIVMKMDQADGVVFASPVYTNNVSGLMKAFIDRISYNGHRPRFFGKKAFFISTTGMFGTRKVLKYMSSVVGDWWGFEAVGGVGIVTKNGPMPKDQIEHNSKLLAQAAKKYTRALRSNTLKSPTLKDVIVFNWAKGAISQLEEVSPADYRYWLEKGWLSKKARYYTNTPVNPLYRAIGALFEKVQGNKAKKELMAASTGTTLSVQ
jgi:multimeric flavodoxin WrbA